MLGGCRSVMVIKRYLLIQAEGGAPTAFSCSMHPLRKYHFGSGATQRLGKCLPLERTASSTVRSGSARRPEKEPARVCCLATNAAGTLDGPERRKQRLPCRGSHLSSEGFRGGAGRNDRGATRCRQRILAAMSSEQVRGWPLGRLLPAAKLPWCFKSDRSLGLPDFPSVTPRVTASLSHLCSGILRFFGENFYMSSSQSFVLGVVITTKHVSGAVCQQFKLQFHSAPTVLMVGVFGWGKLRVGNCL